MRLLTAVYLDTSQDALMTIRRRLAKLIREYRLGVKTPWAKLELIATTMVRGCRNTVLLWHAKHMDHGYLDCVRQHREWYQHNGYHMHLSPLNFFSRRCTFFCRPRWPMKISQIEKQFVGVATTRWEARNQDIAILRILLFGHLIPFPVKCTYIKYLQ